MSETPCPHMDTLATLVAPDGKRPYESTWNLEERPMMVSNNIAPRWDEMSIDDRAASIATEYLSAICWQGGPAALASFLRWTYEGVYGGRDWEGEDDRRFRACLDGAEGKTPSPDVELLKTIERSLEDAFSCLDVAFRTLSDARDHLVAAVPGKRLRRQLDTYLRDALASLGEGRSLVYSANVRDNDDTPPF